MTCMRHMAISVMASFALVASATDAVLAQTSGKFISDKDAVHMNDISEPTANEAAKRFLAFVSRMNRLSEASAEGLEKALGLSFGREGTVAGYRSAAGPDGWQYFVDFYFRDPPLRNGFSFEFVNLGGSTDLSPVCFDFDLLRSTLHKAGFDEQKRVGEIGELISFNYFKNDVKLAVIIQSPTTGDVNRNCVRRIQTLQ